MDTLDIRERAGSYPTRAQRNSANDDAQIRMRRVLTKLNAAHGAVIHDLTVVIDGSGDEDVRGAAEDIRASLENALADAGAGLKWAVDASGCEIHELPRAAVPAMED